MSWDFGDSLKTYEEFTLNIDDLILKIRNIHEEEFTKKVNFFLEFTERAFSRISWIEDFPEEKKRLETQEEESFTYLGFRFVEEILSRIHRSSFEDIKYRCFASEFGQLYLLARTNLLTVMGNSDKFPYRDLNYFIKIFDVCYELEGEILLSDQIGEDQKFSDCRNIGCVLSNIKKLIVAGFIFPERINNYIKVRERIYLR